MTAAAEPLGWKTCWLGILQDGIGLFQLAQKLHIKTFMVSSHRPYYGQVTMSHMMGPADGYPPSAYLPRAASDQHSTNNYLPSVSYSLDHLDRLEYQVTSVPALSCISIQLDPKF